MARPTKIPKSALIILAILISFNAQLVASNQQPEEAIEQDSLIISPSPRDYVKLFQRTCERPQRPTKQELIRFYSNETKPGSERMRRLLETHRIEKECRRELSAWRYRYIDEDGQVLIREDSIDERLANVVYTTRTIKAFAIDSFTYDSGNKSLDERNMELAAGPQVSDQLCGEHLRQMLRQLHELEMKNQRIANKQQQVILTDQQISLAKILDSFGRYAPGFLYGRTLSMGAYEQCQSNQLVLNVTSKINMRYCWANMNLQKHLDLSLKARFRDHLETDTDVLSTGICIPESCHSKSFAKFREEFQALLDSQFKLPNSMYVDETLPMESLYCLVDEGSAFKVPLFGRLLLVYLVVWLLLTIVITMRSSPRRERSRNGFSRVLASFNLVDSWTNFLEARERSGRDQSVELNTLNIVKVLGSLAVVLAHSLALFIGFAQDEVHSAKAIENDTIMLIMVVASLIVDTFFAISGILWAFFTLKRIYKYDKRNAAATKSADLLEGERTKVNNSLAETQFVQVPPVDIETSLTANNDLESSKNNNHETRYNSVTKEDGQLKELRIKPSDGARFFFTNWLMLTIFRYLRIMPLFVLVHWFKKFVFIYAGSGPLWDHGFNAKSINGACLQETMWTPFTFLSAYYPLSHQCTLQSWSISNDMFFAILAPPAVILIYKRPRLAIWFTLTLCFMSYLSAQHAVHSQPSYIDEELRELRSWGFYRLFDKASLLYTAPHYRIFCFLIGVWGGYFLLKHQMKSTGHNQEVRVIGNDKAVWPWWLRGPATWLSIIYIVSIYMAFIFNGYVKLYLDPFYRIFYPQFVSSMRFVWALANTIIFLRMMTDWKETFWMRLSSAKIWQIFSKLNYPILLVHMDLLLYTVQVAQTPTTNITCWAFINMGLGVFLACIPICILLHVIYENPMDKLIRSFLPKY